VSLEATPEQAALDEVWVTYRKGTLYNVWDSLDSTQQYESIGNDAHVRYVKATRADRPTITFDLMETTDPELTCVACYRTACDSEFRLRVRGTTAWYGIHTKCLDGLRARNESRADNRICGYCGKIGCFAGPKCAAVPPVDPSDEVIVDALKAKAEAGRKTRPIGAVGSQDAADGAVLSDADVQRIANLHRPADLCRMYLNASERAEAAEARVRELTEALLVADERLSESGFGDDAPTRTLIRAALKTDS
jgi:hypothetical protein